MASAQNPDLATAQNPEDPAMQEEIIGAPDYLSQNGLRRAIGQAKANLTRKTRAFLALLRAPPYTRQELVQVRDEMVVACEALGAELDEYSRQGNDTAHAIYVDGCRRQGICMGEHRREYEDALAQFLDADSIRSRSTASSYATRISARSTGPRLRETVERETEHRARALRREHRERSRELQLEVLRQDERLRREREEEEERARLVRVQREEERTRAAQERILRLRQEALDDQAEMEADQLARDHEEALHHIGATASLPPSPVRSPRSPPPVALLLGGPRPTSPRNADIANPEPHARPQGMRPTPPIRASPPREARPPAETPSRHVTPPRRPTPRPRTQVPLDQPPIRTVDPPPENQSARRPTDADHVLPDAEPRFSIARHCSASEPVNLLSSEMQAQLQLAERQLALEERKRRLEAQRLADLERLAEVERQRALEVARSNKELEQQVRLQQELNRLQSSASSPDPRAAQRNRLDPPVLVRTAEEIIPVKESPPNETVQTSYLGLPRATGVTMPGVSRETPSSNHYLALLASRPPPGTERKKFEGTVLDYPRFLADYQLETTNLNGDPALCLRVLDRLVTKDAASIISHNLVAVENPAEDLREALETLEMAYGTQRKQSRVQLNALLAHGKVTSTQKSLMEFYSALKGCYKIMKRCGRLPELNTESTLSALYAKLPSNIQTQWKVAVGANQTATYDILMDVIFRAHQMQAGDINQWEEAANASRSNKTDHPRPKSKGAVKINQYSTQVGQAYHQLAYPPIVPSNSWGMAAGRICLCDPSLGLTHSCLSECPSYQAAQDIPQRWVLVQQAGPVCYRCFRKGHKAHECPEGPCGINGCTRRHHPSLHDPTKEYRPRRSKGGPGNYAASYPRPYGYQQPMAQPHYNGNHAPPPSSYMENAAPQYPLPRFSSVPLAAPVPAVLPATHGPRYPTTGTLGPNPSPAVTQVPAYQQPGVVPPPVETTATSLATQATAIPQPSLVAASQVPMAPCPPTSQAPQVQVTPAQAPQDPVAPGHSTSS